jgi:hypothetical protein
MDLVLQSGRADRLMLLGLCLTSVRVYKEDQLSVGVDGRGLSRCMSNCIGLKFAIR